MTVIPPAEKDEAVFDLEEAMIGDSDAVGVAAEILDHLSRAAEGALGVDDPSTARGCCGKKPVSLRALGSRWTKGVACHEQAVHRPHLVPHGEGAAVPLQRIDLGDVDGGALGNVLLPARLTAHRMEPPG